MSKTLGECLCCLCERISDLETNQLLIINELKEIKESLKCECDCKKPKET